VEHNKMTTKKMQ